MVEGCVAGSDFVERLSKIHLQSCSLVRSLASDADAMIAGLIKIEKRRDYPIKLGFEIFHIDNNTLSHPSRRTTSLSHLSSKHSVASLQKCSLVIQVCNCLVVNGGLREKGIWRNSWPCMHEDLLIGWNLDWPARVDQFRSKLSRRCIKVLDRFDC